ncbi:hypothetical protein HNR09_002339 [Nesterenkonia xinjiangensis]|uniref:Bacteriocin biosynthesis cyclodehydratase domain-containing protein n=1 Tax=Nesterenkonia xinjiangensis TaxID=225327 RepID=A0A7Z0GPW6_9MICC|nr:hypothetical protein [Nesterenkonia xinjiangensis]
MDVTTPALIYRLPPDAIATVLDEATVRLQAGDASVLVDGDAETVLAATKSLACGVPVAAAPEVVEQLWTHGVLQRDDGAPTAELRRARLAMSCVLVDGLSDCGARLAELLVDLGVGTVVLRDGTEISEEDEGERLRRGRRGRRRAEVLTELLRASADGTAVLECPAEGGVQGADVQVLVRAEGASWPSREQLQARLRETSRVLPISVGEQGALLGPVVAAAGPSPCPACLESHRPGTAEASPSGARSTGGSPLPGLCAHLAALQLRELLAGQQLPDLTDTVIHIDAGTGTVRSRPVPPAADCPCRAQSELFGVPSESPESPEPLESLESPELSEVPGPSEPVDVEGPS